MSDTQYPSTTKHNSGSASWRYFPTILGTLVGWLITLLFVAAGADPSNAARLGAVLATIGYTIQAISIACQPERFPRWRISFDDQ